jgi:uncharacterized lipoprotein YmbA
MFNPMEPHELVLGVGRVLRMAADGEPVDGYRRSQLLSAYSVARHLAAEQAAAAELLAWLRAELADALGPDTLAGATTGPQLGAALTALLAGPLDDGLRARLHRILAEMADREVAALAGAGS